MEEDDRAKVAVGVKVRFAVQTSRRSAVVQAVTIEKSRLHYARYHDARHSNWSGIKGIAVE